MTRIIAIIGLIFGIGPWSSIEAQVKFYAQTNGSKVLEGSYIQVSFVLENANGSSFQTPDFKGFRIVGGPSQSSSTTINNGARSSSITYQYAIMAEKAGIYTIEPATIIVSGQKLQTEPLKIEVVKKSASSATSQAPDAFIKMSISDSTAVLGQRLVLIYTLYYDVQLDVRDEQIRSEDPFTAFNAERINNSLRPSIQREIIGNKEYYYKVIAATSLVPKETGNIKINSLHCNVLIPDNTRRRSFFSQMTAIPASSNSLTINVEALPLRKPYNNSGAIGQYSISSTINRNKITEDQSITLNLKIKGDGVSKDVIAPVYESTDELDIYDPSLISENAYLSNGRLFHEAVYEYLIVPKKTGNVEFTPEFIYFDTHSLAYRTISSSTHQINIRKSNDVSKNDDSQAIQQEAAELAPLAITTELETKTASFYKSSAYWVILASLILAFIAMLIYKWILVQKSKEDPELVKARIAKKIALEKLKLAKTYLDQNELKPFYKEISNAMLGYVSDKLKMNTADITKTNVANKLNKLNVNDTETNKFVSILANAEMALYAGSQDAKGMQQTYDEVATLISNIEGQLVDTTI